MGFLKLMVRLFVRHLMLNIMLTQRDNYYTSWTMKYLKRLENAKLTQFVFGAKWLIAITQTQKLNGLNAMPFFLLTWKVTYKTDLLFEYLTKIKSFFFVTQIATPSRIQLFYIVYLYHLSWSKFSRCKTTWIHFSFLQKVSFEP